MGFFNSSKYNDIERGLLDLYTQMMSMTMGSEAKKNTEDMLNQAIEDSKRRIATRYDRLAQNFLATVCYWL